MSSLGFGGAAGVGRPFTIQDLFSAVSQPFAPSVTTTVTVINQYLDEESESVTIEDVFTLAASNPVTYDTAAWQDGVWT